MGKKKSPSSFPSPAGRTAPKDKIRLPSGRPDPESSAAPAGERSFREEADYYRLKMQAVEDLVTASPENSPPVSRRELRKYHAGPKIRIADWIKAVFLKFWIAGMICYFFIWGLSSFAMNQWDMILILGVVLGGATHLLTNNILRFISRTKGAYDRWMMFPKDKLFFLPLQVIYALLLILCTVMTYNGINLLAAGGPAGSAPVLGVEPLLFGVIVTLWDLLFLGVKRLFLRILEDARKKAGG